MKLSGIMQHNCQFLGRSQTGGLVVLVQPHSSARDGKPSHGANLSNSLYGYLVLG